MHPLGLSNNKNLPETLQASAKHSATVPMKDRGTVRMLTLQSDHLRERRVECDGPHTAHRTFLKCVRRVLLADGIAASVSLPILDSVCLSSPGRRQTWKTSAHRPAHATLGAYSASRESEGPRGTTTRDQKRNEPCVSGFPKTRRLSKRTV